MDDAHVIPDVPQPVADADRAAAAASALGRVIHTARAGRYTLAGLAARAGISTGVLSLIERGRGNPSFTTLVRIATALETSPADLVSAAMAATVQPPAESAVAGGVGRSISGPVVAADGGPWQTQMVIRDGQEASVLVREGALELSMRDVTAAFVPEGSNTRLAVDIGLVTGSAGASLALPPAHDPRWLPIIRGETPFQPSSLAGRLLYTHAVRCTTQDPSSANVQHWISELRGLLLEVGPVNQELQEIFG